jgi:hypothetical protein
MSSYVGQASWPVSMALRATKIHENPRRFRVGQDGILRGDCQSPRGPIDNRPAGCLPASLPHIRVFDAAFFSVAPAGVAS